MDSIKIDQSFWELFPDAQVNVLTLHGINNTYSDENSSQQLLDEAETNSRQYLLEDNFSDNEVIQSWRKTYQAFKKKKGARASIEALLKRVSQNKGVGTINPLVDIYNSISMNFAVPVGGEDMATILGDLHLGVAQGGEPFYPLGDDDNEPALSGEVIYYDDDGAICRCLNWRDGKRTMLTENTSDAVLFIEATNDEQKKNIDKAIDDLQSKAKQYLGVKGSVYRLTKDNPIIEK